MLAASGASRQVGEAPQRTERSVPLACSWNRDPGRRAGSGGSPTDFRCGGRVGPSVGVVCTGGGGGGSILSAHWMHFPGESRDFGDFGRIAPKAGNIPRQDFRWLPRAWPRSHVSWECGGAIGSILNTCRDAQCERRLRSDPPEIADVSMCRLSREVTKARAMRNELQT